MGAERDVILHQRVGELEQIRDANLASLHFPLLFPHCELGWHLEVRYQSNATSHKNIKISCGITTTEFHVAILPHTDSASSQIGTHCSIALQDYFCVWFTH